MTIKEKAIFALKSRDAQDPRCGVLLMMLSISCRISSDECERKIEELAK